MLNKVKEVLGVELSQEQEVKLAQAELENGTVIESDDFVSGAEVFIVTEDERVALPVGEYKLVDGEVLIVEEEGIIASIGAQEEEPAEEEVEAAEEDKQEMNYATKEELAEVKEMVEEIKQMLDPKEEMSAETETAEPKVTENAEELSAEIKEELSAEQTVEKVTHNPEAETKKSMNLYAQKRQLTTADKVLQRIANIKNKK